MAKHKPDELEILFVASKGQRRHVYYRLGRDGWAGGLLVRDAVIFARSADRAIKHLLDRHRCGFINRAEKSAVRTMHAIEDASEVAA